MRLSLALWRIFYCLALPAILSTLILYNYPFVFGCAFPQPRSSSSPPIVTGQTASLAPPTAPFRLLAFGDPQIEGDSSLPDPNAPLLPSLRKLWRRDYSDFSRGFPTERPTVASCLKELLHEDLPRLFQRYRKRLDLFGNDYYLAHIYRTLNRYLQPTHVVVLGDLIGSQWISDGEFERRSRRFWDRVFKHGHRVGDELMDGAIIDLGPENDDHSWSRRIINVPGNHDIGYAGDITHQRISRFEHAYGKVNWDITFTYPTSTTNASTSQESPETIPPPTLRLIILNDMNLDGPNYDPTLQASTFDFLNERIIRQAPPVEDNTAATILLTHVPLHKEDGVCTDSRFFDYGPSGLREQNHLSYGSTVPLLEGVFGLHPDAEVPGDGMGRRGVILSGHDHEGCDVYHYYPRNSSASASGREATWTGRRWADAGDIVHDGNIPGIREITVRSMMGSYGGNAGLLSAWFDDVAQEWRFEYDTCAVGVQHWWWAIHVLDLITWGVLGAALLSSSFERIAGRRDAEAMAPKKFARVETGKRRTVREALAEDLSDEKMYGDLSILATGNGIGYEAAANLPRNRTRF